MIDRLSNLRLSISYDRVLGLNTDLASAVCAYYTDNEVVCPPQMNHGVFITAAVDNIDHNPTSNTLKG